MTFDRAHTTMGSVLSNLHLSAGKKAVRLFDMNKSPTCICSVTIYGNNSRKRKALLTSAFSNSRWSPLKRELTLWLFPQGEAVK